MAQVEKTVFISYRRKDISWALAVYQYLTRQNYDVFFDYTSLSGGDFEQVIVSNIKARAHFVLILTPTALNRCNEPGDWLRREIETAVDEKRNLVPLFFDGFNFGSPDIIQNLTGKLSSINRYNGLDVPAGYFLEAMERLSSRYLNVPLDGVIHPVPTEVQKVVRDQQAAANMALFEKSKNIHEMAKPVEKVSRGRKQVESTAPSTYPSHRQTDNISRTGNLRLFGFGAGILLVVIVGGIGISAVISNIRGAAKAPTEMDPNRKIIPVAGSTISPHANTATPEPEIIIVTSTVVTENPDFIVVPTQDVGTTRISSIDGETLIAISPGSFVMGLTPEQTDILRQLCDTPDCEKLYRASQPAHEVEITKGYWIYKTEVSNAQYARCVNSGVCNPPISNSSVGHGSFFDNPEYADYPVVWIDWDCAVAYCSKWAGGRLPTSAEWEYAARGNAGWLFPWGDDSPDAAHANVDNLREGKATAISTFVEYPSPFGLLDMTGNVWEWVSDWYSPTYYSDNTNWVNPMGPPSGDLRVGRGGSWWINSALSSVAIQDWFEPNNADNYDGVGFRCAMDAE